MSKMTHYGLVKVSQREEGKRRASVSGKQTSSAKALWQQLYLLRGR